MSGLLAGKVWQSNLDSHLKPLAAAMADIANDDGSRIFPSVAYLAWLLGKGERSVQQGLSELKSLGVIEAVAFQSGGRNHPTEYRLIETSLPYRVPWNEVRKGATSAPFVSIKGATNDIKGCNFEQQRVQFSTERVQCTAPDPLVEPLEDPLVEPLEVARSRKPSVSSLTENEFLTHLETNPAYAGIDVRRLNDKMIAWCEVNGKRPTRRRLVNWLNREDRPMENGNGSNKKRFESSTERNARNLRENAEYIRGLQNGGSEIDREDPIGLLTSGI